MTRPQPEIVQGEDDRNSLAHVGKPSQIEITFWRMQVVEMEDIRHARREVEQVPGAWKIKTIFVSLPLPNKTDGFPYCLRKPHQVVPCVCSPCNESDLFSPRCSNTVANMPPLPRPGTSVGLMLNEQHVGIVPPFIPHGQPCLDTACTVAFVEHASAALGATVDIGGAHQQNAAPAVIHTASRRSCA
jgi:hypothetical protein